MTRASSGSMPQRFQNEPGGSLAGRILLAGDEVAVPDGKTTPQSGLDVIRAEFFLLILDAPGHDVFVTRQQVHAPDCVVGEIFFDRGTGATIRSARSRSASW